jgi:DNA polymerase-3 subunit alpha
MVEYAQIHAHTKYSIQDAIPSHKDYVDAIYEHNQQSSKYKCIAFGATDHGNIYGMVKQYNACNKPDHKERAIKGIYGCEVYHCNDVDNNPNGERYHLVLLAATQEGLTNLYEIVSHAGTHIIHGRQKDFPVTDLKFMSQHGKGIIALTACVAGIVPQYIINGDDKTALQYIDTLHNIFDEVYLEVQPHEFPEQLLVNSKLVSFAAQTGFKLVMTSDSHYIHSGDNQYHNILKNMCHQKLFTTNNHLYTPEEMEDYCIKYGIPLDCISNTGEIAHQCNVDPKPKDHRGLLPLFPCPEGFNESTYLRKLSMEKLQEKIIKNKITNPKKYIKQLNYELEIICNAGFAGYFLILWDWFEWCRANDILC